MSKITKIKVSGVEYDIGADYENITNKPPLHDDSKQDILVSGTNIKTINNQSILGSGNIDLSNDKNFVYVQHEPSDTWIIEHNLNKYPSVTIMDSANSVMIGDIKYINENKLEVKFTSSPTGTAVLN